jgi:hypothetical protein
MMRCASTTTEFDTEFLTDEQKLEIAQRRDGLLKESHFLQLAIDILERQERQEREKLD